MIRRHLIANYLSAAWVGVMSLAFLPVYVQFLGVEAFGLIGAFAVLQGWFQVLDMGLSPTLTREMARFSAGAHTPQSIRNLLYTAELIFLGVGLLLAVALAAGAGWLATHWFNADHLSPHTIRQTLMIAATIVACRWMSTLYRSALLGLQQQVWLSILNAAFATIRNAGIVAVLVFVAPTIEVFFAYQAGMSILELLILAVRARGALPAPPARPTFSITSLRDVWHFAAGLTLITVLATLLTQVDKLLLSTLLPLSEFGYFTLATTMAGGLSLLIGPLASVAYPRLTALVEQGDEKRLINQYHALSQVLACIVLPPALVLSVFAREVAYVWTGDLAIADAVAPVLRVWVVGTALNGLMHTPYLVQLAHGWTRLTVTTNIVAVAASVPALLILVPKHGAIAAAWVWVGINAGYLIFSLPLMHRRILQTERSAWYWRDFVQPLTAAGVAVATSMIARAVLPIEGRLADFVFLLVVLMLTYLSSTLSTPSGRQAFQMAPRRFVRS